MEKVCFKCKRLLPIDEFYRHPQMGDGHLNKCKACAKSDVRTNRAARREYYSKYERERFQRAERKKSAMESLRRQREANPKKKKAREIVAQAVRSGRIQREPCFFCGAVKTEGHHSNYEEPLNVTWVCFKCHRERFHNQVVISE